MKPVAKKTERGRYKAQIVSPGAGKNGADLVLFMAPQSFAEEDHAMVHARGVTDAVDESVLLREELETANNKIKSAQARIDELRDERDVANETASQRQAHNAAQAKRITSLSEELAASAKSLDEANQRSTELEADLNCAQEAAADRDVVDKANNRLRADLIKEGGRADMAQHRVTGLKWLLASTVFFFCAIIVILVDTHVGWDRFLG